MSLEVATKISQLVPTNPAGSDPKSQGDDHLRMLKTVLQNNAIKSEIGQSATAANNFSLDASADNGTMKLARASGQDIISVAANGTISFPQMEQSLAANGYIKLPGGLIIQWGSGSTTSSGQTTITFPIPFPNAALSAQAVCRSTVGAAGIAQCAVTGLTDSTVLVGLLTPAGVWFESGFFWLAIGF